MIIWLFSGAALDQSFTKYNNTLIFFVCVVSS